MAQAVSAKLFHDRATLQRESRTAKVCPTMCAEWWASLSRGQLFLTYTKGTEITNSRFGRSEAPALARNREGLRISEPFRGGRAN